MIKNDKATSNSNDFSNDQYKVLFQEMLSGFAYHEMIYDENKNPIDYRFIFVNKAFEELTGLKAQDVEGKRVLEILPDTEKYWIEKYAHVASTGEAMQFENYSKGLNRYYEVKAYRPKANHFAVIFNDISARKNDERIKEEIQEQLIHAEKLSSLGILAAGIAHEINNPLAIIRGNLKMLSDNSKNLCTSRCGEYRDKIDKALNRIITIVEKIKIYSYKDTDTISNVNIHQSLKDTISMCDTIVTKNKLEIKTQFYDEEKTGQEATIRANEGKLSQVFLNLIVNAKDALENKEDAILEISTSKNSDGLLCIKFKDNGTGIPKQIIDKIFLPFFTTKPIGKGTGLGLSICQSIVSNFGGKISVTSKEGEGTEFLITFNSYSKEKEKEKENKNQDKDIKQNSSSADDKIQINKKNVLIMDDEPEFRYYLRNSLETIKSFHIDEASHGIEGLGLAKKKHFDIILMDLRMPHMDGFQFLESMKESELEKTLVIVITGLNTLEFSNQEKKILERKKVQIIRKPFERDELLRLLIK